MNKNTNLNDKFCMITVLAAGSYFIGRLLVSLLFGL